ncbi:hypothetical protein D8B26_002342 [Coccidioides posadasii str. Silveira]|uniref:Uncharacterized protein n=1 Tax=Coccidioides posadasii (strain RMSCC 757 / Silveira) TaxID=443226 RepID=E9DD30_COCPS|nr:conserved hypothetical protein [Coccidioides posadasii str. Silveira]QVM07649.1 hypothetical protein D8B26_002342 [Coccidioides posadasii str. Silveira]
MRLGPGKLENLQGKDKPSSKVSRGIQPKYGVGGKEFRAEAFRGWANLAKHDDRVYQESTPSPSEYYLVALLARAAETLPSCWDGPHMKFKATISPDNLYIPVELGDGRFEQVALVYGRTMIQTSRSAATPDKWKDGKTKVVVVWKRDA